LNVSTNRSDNFIQHRLSEAYFELGSEKHYIHKGEKEYIKSKRLPKISIKNKKRRILTAFS